MRATLEKSAFGLSLDGIFGIMGIEGFISSTTFSLGGITYRGASRVSFCLSYPSTFCCTMGSCSSMGLGVLFPNLLVH